jgi:hypothetical protein
MKIVKQSNFKENDMFQKFLVCVLSVVMALSITGCDLTLETAEVLVQNATIITDGGGKHFLGWLTYQDKVFYGDVQLLNGIPFIKAGMKNWLQIDILSRRYFANNYTYVSWAELPTEVKIIVYENLPIMIATEIPKYAVAGSNMVIAGVASANIEITHDNPEENPYLYFLLFGSPQILQ